MSKLVFLIISSFTQKYSKSTNSKKYLIIFSNILYSNFILGSNCGIEILMISFISMIIFIVDFSLSVPSPTGCCTIHG
jgi:hypothetical protein